MHLERVLVRDQVQEARRGVWISQILFKGVTMAIFKKIRSILSSQLERDQIL